jgi:probable HAF family extracellular repeat protein
MKSILYRRLTACVVVMALAHSAVVPCSFGGKPMPPPPLPPIKFQIQLWDVPYGGGKYINKMNNLGQVVGWYSHPNGEKHGFLYDPTVNANTAIYLNDVVATPAGWMISSAVGINNRGAIVGYLEPVGSSFDPNFRMGFILDMAAETPTLLPLPDAQWAYAWGTSINENGDVLGIYRTAAGGYGIYVWNSGLYAPANPMPLLLGQDVTIANATPKLNNPVGDRPAQVAGQLATGPTQYGTAFRWTPGQSLETFPELQSPVVSDINDSGTFCGRVVAKPSNKPASPYQMRFNTNLELLGVSVQGDFFSDINGDGDLINNAALYRDGWRFLNPNDLIDLNDPDAAIWFSASDVNLSDLNERDDITGFGQMVGRIGFADHSALCFILTPAPSP